MKETIIDWETEPPGLPDAQLDATGHFSARGMRWIYGRGDQFGRKARFNIDIWLARSGDVYIRFWSRSDEVDNLSLILRDVPPTLFADHQRGRPSSDAWIPEIVRTAYDEWVSSEC